MFSLHWEILTIVHYKHIFLSIFVNFILQLRIPEETKRILSKEVGERTEQEIYSVR